MNCSIVISEVRETETYNKKKGIDNMKLSNEINISQDIHEAINKQGLKVRYAELVSEDESQNHLRKILAYKDLGRDGKYYTTFLYNTYSRNLFNKKSHMRVLEAMRDYTERT